MLDTANYTPRLKALFADTIKPAMMEEFGCGMMAWSPLAQGFLSGKITRENYKDGDHRLASFDFIPKNEDQCFAAVDALRAMAEQKDCSVAQLALAWLLHTGATTLIIGASKIEHLRDNLGAGEVELTADEMDTLDALVPPVATYRFPSRVMKRLSPRLALSKSPSTASGGSIARS